MSHSQMGLAVALLLATGCSTQPGQEEVIGGTSELSASCMSLNTCCPTLPADVVMSCKTLSAQTADAECASLLTALQTAGRCGATDYGGEAGAADASATSADAGGPLPPVACTLLSGCCPGSNSPSDNTSTCGMVVSGGMESQCAPLLQTLTSSNMCASASAGLGGACPELQQCCSLQTFPAEFSTSCLGTWNSGDDTACSTMLTAYESAGYCGKQPDPDCALLNMCCNEISFPAAQLSTCQEIVAGNEGGNCLSAYETYCGQQ